jgi:hypothetical protein
MALFASFQLNIYWGVENYIETSPIATPSTGQAKANKN